MDLINLQILFNDSLDKLYATLPEPENRKAMLAVGAGILKDAYERIIEIYGTSELLVLQILEQVEMPRLEGADQWEELRDQLQARSQLPLLPSQRQLAAAGKGLALALEHQHQEKELISNIVYLATQSRQAIGFLEPTDQNRITQIHEGQRQLRWLDNFSKNFCEHVFDTSIPGRRRRLSPLAVPEQDMGSNIDLD